MRSVLHGNPIRTCIKHGSKLSNHRNPSGSRNNDNNSNSKLNVNSVSNLCRFRCVQTRSDSAYISLGDKKKETRCAQRNAAAVLDGFYGNINGY